MAVKYNLGCGINRKPGYINVDKLAEVKPDIVWDIAKIPWPWAQSNSTDLIEADNSLEHIDPGPRLDIICECHRVLKPSGILWMRVPPVAPDNLEAAFQDPTHRSYFTSNTFDYFDHRHNRWKRFGRFYGIPPFERVRQERKGRFLIVELKAVK